MDVERTVGILNAVAAGLFRIVEILVPLIIIMIVGISKAMLSAFAGANVYRETRSKKKLLTYLDEI